jgi:hypothetical protein
MEPIQMVIAAVVAILVIVALYYLWKWLYGNSDMQDMVIYSSPSDGLPGKDVSSKVFSGAQVPQIYGGGEYSISTWIYVTNWGINKGKNKPFLVLSGGSPEASGLMTMVMYLGQFTNKLGVRVSVESASSNTGDLTYTRDYAAIVAGTSPYTDSSPDFKKCDIEQVDLQKWVNITAVLSGRTLDIFIDGKLSRSCLLDGLFKVDGETPTLKLGGPNGFGGLIGMTRAANFAYSPDRVYSYYQQGPFSSFSLSSLNPGEYSIDLKRNGSPVFSSSTG